MDDVSGINKKKLQDWFWAYFMILPTVAGTLIFSIWPLIQSFYLSFTEWGAFGSYDWGGTVNFERMLGDSVLWQALRNTIVFTVGSVPFDCSIDYSSVLLNTRPGACPPIARCTFCRWSRWPGHGLALALQR